MYAIVKVGAKQYRVKPGDIIYAEKLEAKSGKSINLTEVMLVSDSQELAVGSPFVKGAHVVAQFLGDVKARKTISYKYRRRKNWHTKKGHRQVLSKLEIKKIAFGEKSK
ncbi:MAG: 50S ribosomal protein L21 [Candidatus Omnitrophota bacterium]